MLTDAGATGRPVNAIFATCLSAAAAAAAAAENRTLRHGAGLSIRRSAADVREGATPVDAELKRFDAHPDEVRGLAVKTRAKYRRTVGRFLREHFAAGHIDLAAMTPDNMRELVARQSALYRIPGGAANRFSAFRAPCACARPVAIRCMA